MLELCIKCNLQEKTGEPDDVRATRLAEEITSAFEYIFDDVLCKQLVYSTEENELYVKVALNDLEFLDYVIEK